MSFPVRQDIEKTFLYLEDKILRHNIPWGHSVLYKDIPDFLFAASAHNFQYTLQFVVSNVSGVPEHYPQKGVLLPYGLYGLRVDDPSFREKEVYCAAVGGYVQGSAFSLSGNQLKYTGNTQGFNLPLQALFTSGDHIVFQPQGIKRSPTPDYT